MSLWSSCSGPKTDHGMGRVTPCPEVPVLLSSLLGLRQPVGSKVCVNNLWQVACVLVPWPWYTKRVFGYGFAVYVLVTRYLYCVHVPTCSVEPVVLERALLARGRQSAGSWGGGGGGGRACRRLLQLFEGADRSIDAHQV